MLNINNLTRLIIKATHWFVIPTIAALMVMWPSVQSGLERLQPDYGDVLFNLYLFEHIFQHFTSLDIFNQALFWSPDFYWPVANVYTWSDHLLGPSVL